MIYQKGKQPLLRVRQNQQGVEDKDSEGGATKGGTHQGGATPGQDIYNIVMFSDAKAHGKVKGVMRIKEE